MESDDRPESLADFCECSSFLIKAAVLRLINIFKKTVAFAIFFFFSCWEKSAWGLNPQPCWELIGSSPSAISSNRYSRNEEAISSFLQAALLLWSAFESTLNTEILRLIL